MMGVNTDTWDTDDKRRKNYVLETFSTFGVASSKIEADYDVSDYEETAQLISNLKQLGLLNKDILKELMLRSSYDIKSANAVHRYLNQANYLDKDTFIFFATSSEISSSILHQLRCNDLLNRENLEAIHRSGKDLKTIDNEIDAFRGQNKSLCQEDLDGILDNENTFGMGM